MNKDESSIICNYCIITVISKYMPISHLYSSWTRTLSPLIAARSIFKRTATFSTSSVTFKAHTPSIMSVADINKTAHEFDKSDLDAVLTRRFFYAPAFEIYGGVAGLYDYGPTGSSLQANILDVWRKHYIIEEDMLELDTTIMTLADVLKTSGHVDK